MDATTEAGHEPLVYPEPLFSPSLIDAAAFLYFEHPLIITLAPAPTLAGGGFEVSDWVIDRRPPWGPRFLLLEELWGQESDGCVAAVQLLEPVRARFKAALIATPGDLEALARADELIRATGFDEDKMRSIVDPVVAAGELMNHLFLEMWLELNEDTEALYRYTGELFSDPIRLEQTLQRAYMLRIAHLPGSAHFEPLFLNSPRLAPFLLALPGADEAMERQPELAFKLGMASWEVFRQLLRPHLEPLDVRSVEILSECLRDRGGEVKALKLQTERLAEHLGEVDEPDALMRQVEKLIRLHVADDLADLLRLNTSAKQRYLDALLGDRAVWAAVLAALHGATSGSVEWTMGGAVGTIATLASKGYSTYADRRRQLASSDYRLIYNIVRST